MVALGCGVKVLGDYDLLIGVSLEQWDLLGPFDRFGPFAGFIFFW